MTQSSRRTASPQAGPQSVVVTGAGRGIGRGIAVRLVQRGFAVVLSDVDAEAARRTATEIGAVEGLEQDVRDRDSHHRVAEAALAHGPLRAWFNNAGVGDDGRLADLTDEQVQRIVEVNLLGVLWGMRAALSAFGPAGGDIVNTGSLSALGPVPGLSVYAATKAAVLSVSTSVNAEPPSSVRVHALCPDGVDTALVHQMDDAGWGKQLVYSGGRLLSVDEVADQAVAIMDSRRVVRTIPVWRGAVSRTSALAPGLSARAIGIFTRQGRQAIVKSR